MSKGLEALEELKQDLTPMHFSRIEKLDRYKIIEKELKALEIIRNLGILKPYETLGGQCWLEPMFNETQITKNNCDLLTEVFYGKDRVGD